MSPFDTTAPDVAGVRPGTGTGAAVELRGNIFEMTQAAENAVLRPVEPGAFAHDLRAALAARIARLSGDEALAERHLAGAGEKAAIADPSLRRRKASRRYSSSWTRSPTPPATSRKMTSPPSARREWPTRTSCGCAN